MPSHPDHTHPPRHVLLPSGKTIEVVYVEDAERAAAAAPGAGLHVCPACASEFVYPVAWEEAGPAFWAVRLRCPNCEWRTEGTYDQEAVERFDEHLDAGTETMIRELRRLVHANLEHEVERFAEALDHDVIRPEDF